MNYFKIGNRYWDVLVTDVSENFNILHSDKTGRTIGEGAPMYLDPLGTFYGHKIEFARKPGHEKNYDDLWNYLSQPRFDGIPVELVDGQTVIKYNAYVSQGERKLKRIDEKTGKVYWDKFSVNIVPMEAQVKP